MEIIIKGHMKEGKTTIAQAIGILLKRWGIKTTIVEEFGEELKFNRTLHNKKMLSIGEKDLEVTIRTEQLSRTAHLKRKTPR